MVTENHTVTDLDEVLWAIGRTPSTSGIGLETVGVATDNDGHIKVDEWQNTNVENIYSLGDVCGKALLTPVAIAAGRKCTPFF